MRHDLSFSDEELKDLAELLDHDLQETRTEYRRTRNPSFRARMEYRMGMTERLLERISTDLPPESGS